MSKSYLTADDDVSDDEVVRVGLNGFGRIGRNVFRAVLESPRIDLVGINDVMDFDDMAYLAKYDTVMGRLDGVERDGDALTIGDTSVPLYNVQDPADLPWDELDVDVALECTGVFRTREDASAHLDGGADTVIISAPPKGEEPVKQLVYGVNHDEYEGDDVISNASCTTNSITPVAKVLDAEFGIDAGTLTTVHAYTGSQSLIDGPKAKTRRGRAAAENIVPTSTGAAGAAQEVLPQLEGRSTGWRCVFPSRPARSPSSSSASMRTSPRTRSTPPSATPPTPGRSRACSATPTTRSSPATSSASRSPATSTCSRRTSSPVGSS